jgi:hypothetical protein
LWTEFTGSCLQLLKRQRSGGITVQDQAGKKVRETLISINRSWVWDSHLSFQLLGKSGSIMDPGTQKKRHYIYIAKAKMAGDIAQVAELLPSKCEYLKSTSGTARN